jgi:hypothetical protein
VPETEEMIWILGGMFRTDSDQHYPAHLVTVDGFRSIARR